MSKETYFFSHDSNAITDIKILNMRADYGLEGYGLFWCLIEMMRNEETYSLDLDQSTYKAVTILTNTKIDVEKYIHDCIYDYQLFAEENGKFYSNSLLKRMAIKDQKSEMARKKANARWNNNAIVMQQQCNSNTNKEKKSKEKENKEKENKNKIKCAEFVTLTSSEKQKLINAYGEDITNECITVLDNYKGSTGKRYVSDYRAILSWVIDKVTNKVKSMSNQIPKNRYSSYDQRKYDNKSLERFYANRRG